MTVTTTDNTCSDACWKAAQPDCSCSCGGKNHGIMRTPEGAATPPPRTCRIDGVRYELRAIGNFHELTQKRYEINREQYSRYVGMALTGAVRRPPDAAILKRSSKDQQKWPEVVNYPFGRPSLLWVLADSRVTA